MTSKAKKKLRKLCASYGPPRPPKHLWRRNKPQKPGGAYAALWRVVDGAVADAFLQHPEYLSPAGQRMARQSITKRVVGSILGLVRETGRGAPVETESDRG